MGKVNRLIEKAEDKRLNLIKKVGNLYQDYLSTLKVKSERDLKNLRNIFGKNIKPNETVFIINGERYRFLTPDESVKRQALSRDDFNKDFFSFFSPLYNNSGNLLFYKLNNRGKALKSTMPYSAIKTSLELEQ